MRPILIYYLTNWREEIKKTMNVNDIHFFSANFGIPDFQTPTQENP